MRRRAKARCLDLEIAEGGSHTKVVIGERRFVIPRRTEIDEITTRAIYKQLGVTK